MSWGSAAAMLLLAGAFALVALTEEAEAATSSVTISGSRFSPQSIDVHTGDSIRFTNNDGAPHTATASGSWDSGTIRENGGEATVTFSQSGTYNYVCRFHSFMTGTVRVLTQTAENVAPSVSISSPPGGATVRGVAMLSGIATDANNDALAVTVRVDNGPWQSASLTGATWSFAWDTRNLTNAAHSVAARASDGEVTTVSATFTFQVYNAPTITLLTPTADVNGTIGTPVAFTGAAAAAPGSGLAIEVSIDGGEWRAASGRTQWSYAWSTANATTGNHTFQARAGDGSTFALSVVRNVTLVEAPVAPPDEPPVIALFSPSEGASVAGLVNVTGNATDEDGPIPLVEINVLGSGWRNVTARVGTTWWYHWIPEGVAPGVVTFEIRASDAGGSTTLTRKVMLVADPPPLTLGAADDAREGFEIHVNVKSVAPLSLPLVGARVIMLSPEGALLAERVANATGVATFPPVRAGNYTLRGFAPGVSSSLVLAVKPRYESSVAPSAFHFSEIVAVTIHVSSGAPVPNALVQLRGEVLPGGSSETLTTGRDGNVSFLPQPLHAGELEVWVAGNDTGLRVRVLPAIAISWSPDPPVPSKDITLRFTLNDRASSPAAGALVVVDLPGAAREELIADARGEVVVRAAAAGTARVEASLGELRAARAQLAVRTPPGAAELHDLAVRVGAGRIEAGAMVRNIGNGSGSFFVDALATSSGGAALQRTFTTKVLAPGAQELAAFRLPVGPGAYDVVLTVRNSTALIAGTATVTDDGLPPRIEPVYDLSASTPEEQAKTPALGALGAIAALGVLARLRRR